MNRITIAILVTVAVLAGFAWIYKRSSAAPPIELPTSTEDNEGFTSQDFLVSDLSIDSLRKGSYPGSDITIEQTLTAGSNFTRYIASYQSDGNTIYALLTIPKGPKPARGWPVIIFNHGYIPPREYKTAEKYASYVAGFASQGYIVLKPDFRGNGNSEGQPTGAYGSSGYVTDVLNAVASIKRFPEANPAAIGMWGHSMGGFLTLRSMVVTSDIKAGVIWAGVVGSYPDLILNWRRPGITPFAGPTPSPATRRWRNELIAKLGDPKTNPAAWDPLSANSYLKDISGPLQLHHAISDSSVPVEFSGTLEKQMQEVNKPVELYTYANDNHNLSHNFGLAMRRSLEFFNKFLKTN